MPSCRRGHESRVPGAGLAPGGDGIETAPWGSREEFDREQRRDPRMWVEVNPNARLILLGHSPTREGGGPPFFDDHSPRGGSLPDDPFQQELPPVLCSGPRR